MNAVAVKTYNEMYRRISWMTAQYENHESSEDEN